MHTVPGIHSGGIPSLLTVQTVPFLSLLTNPSRKIQYLYLVNGWPQTKVISCERLPVTLSENSLQSITGGGINKNTREKLSLKLYFT